MKIVIVNRFFHPDLSATSQILSDLSFSLAAEHQVVVVASRLRYDDERVRLPRRETVLGVDIRRLPTTGFGRAGITGRALDLVSFHVMAAFALVGLVRSGDVIVAMTDPPLLSLAAALVARLKGARLVNWLQDIYPEVATALGMHGLGWLASVRDASLRHAGANVALGETMAAHLAARGLSAERIRVIPNWTDETKLTPVAQEDNPLRRAWSLEGRFVVAYSGNLGRAHEFETMLGGANLLASEPDIVFLMIGGGHHFGELRRRAEESGLSNIIFQPYQPIEGLAQSIGAGDTHWLSLRPELEGLIVPSKIYGILAAGRPVIAVTAADGEIARLVAAFECGLRVDPGDAPGFAAAIRLLAFEPALVARMGIAARAAATGAFSRQRALSAWHDILRGSLAAD